MDDEESSHDILRGNDSLELPGGVDVRQFLDVKSIDRTEARTQQPHPSMIDRYEPAIPDKCAHDAVDGDLQIAKRRLAQRRWGRDNFGMGRRSRKKVQYMRP